LSQSTLVALALFVLFLVYVTARGRLPQYLAVFFGSVTAPTAESASGTAATGAVSGALGMVQGVQNLLGGGSSPAAILGTPTSVGTTGVSDIGSFFGEAIPAGV